MPCPWWLWGNLLCIDAPLIAVAWQEMFAITWGISLQWSERWVIFLGVWAIYLLDRFLDTRSGSKRVLPAQRHRFAREHPWWMVGGLVGCCFGGLWLALFVLPAEIVQKSIPFFLMLVVYFYWQHGRKGYERSIVLHTIFVGGPFALGVAFIPLALSLCKLPGYGLAVYLLVILFMGNYLEVADAEAQMSGKSSRTVAWQVFLGVAGVGLLFGCLYPLFIFTVAVFISGIFLAGVARFRKEFSEELRTVLAETALLAGPLAVLIFQVAKHFF